MEDISQVYTRLIAAKDMPIDSPEVIDDMAASYIFQQHKDNLIYNEQLDEIYKTCPEIVLNGTVGAHLYGCVQSENISHVACSPSCIDGLKKSNIKECDTPAYKKEKFRLIKLNEIKGETARIFVVNGQKLTTGDKTLLMNHGIKHITTYDQDNNTINYMTGETLDLSITNFDEPVHRSQNTGRTNYAWAWILGILIALIIITVLLVR